MEKFKIEIRGCLFYGHTTGRRQFIDFEDAFVERAQTNPFQERNLQQSDLS